MNLPLILLGLIAIINCPSHAFNQEETYNDVLNRVLKEFDYGKEKVMDKRSEEYYAAAAKDPGKESIGMPGVSPQKHDSYICYGQKVPQDEYYIGFQPKAEMQTAHHLLLFGCEVPFEIQKSWSCGEMHPVCKSGNQHILYAWGKNAPALKLPKGVGFKVGPSTNIKYLVLQVHYGNVEKFIGTKLKDYSGVIMDTTTEKLRYRAGIYVLAEGFSSIPPHEKKWHLDTGCAYQGEADLYPFAVRVHAHKLATAISGYRVRGGKWTLIHKDNPQRPQAFYPLDKQMKIGKGDHLEARCTYNSMSRDTVTHIGATMKDEMCNFYIMYYYDSKMYRTEPPGMCAWGGLDDKMKFPPGSDVLEPSSPESDNKAKHLQYEAVPKWSS